MDERILEALTALTFLFIGLFYFLGSISDILGANAIQAIFEILPWIISLLAFATAVILLHDVSKKREED